MSIAGRGGPDPMLLLDPDMTDPSMVGNMEAGLEMIDSDGGQSPTQKEYEDEHEQETDSSTEGELPLGERTAQRL
jgi:hypothetical protein